MIIDRLRFAALLTAAIACTDVPQVGTGDSPLIETAADSSVVDVRRPGTRGTGFSDSSLSRVTWAQMLINGIGLDTPATRVLEAFGQPVSRTPDEVGEMYGDTISTWRYPDLEITMSDRKVAEIDCRTPRCVTAAGIRVGSPRAIVIAAYGRRPFKGFDPTVDDLTYFHKDVACWLNFGLSKGVVTRVQLYCDNS